MNTIVTQSAGKVKRRPTSYQQAESILNEAVRSALQIPVTSAPAFEQEGPVHLIASALPDAIITTPPRDDFEQAVRRLCTPYPPNEITDARIESMVVLAVKELLSVALDALGLPKSDPDIVWAKITLADLKPFSCFAHRTEAETVCAVAQRWAEQRSLDIGDDFDRLRDMAVSLNAAVQCVEVMHERYVFGARANNQVEAARGALTAVFSAFRQCGRMAAFSNELTRRLTCVKAGCLDWLLRITEADVSAAKVYPAFGQEGGAK